MGKFISLEPIEDSISLPKVVFTHYLCSEGFHCGPPYTRYYIGYMEYDPETIILFNKKGDPLYDISMMDPMQVELFLADKAFTNWKQYNLRPKKSCRSERTILRAPSWSQECIDEAGGNIVMWLTAIRPKVTYAEAVFVMKNEGYNIDNKGFLVPIEGFKQY